MGTGGALVVIDFSEQGNSAYFRGDGWSGQEPDRVWAVGPRSTLKVPIQPSNRSLVLEAEVAPSRAAPMITGQIFRLRVNGTLIGAGRINVRSMIRCEIDAAVAGKSGVLDIEFEFPGFFRPVAVTAPGDERPLSGWFSFARIYTTDMFKPGPWFPASQPDIPVIDLLPATASPADETVTETVYVFGPDGSAAPYRREGWDVGTDDFNWTIAASARLELPAPTTTGAFGMRLAVSPMIEPGIAREQSVVVVLDGVVIGQLKPREPTVSILALPRELTEGRETLEITFLLPDATRVGSGGASAHTPLLGVAVSRIGIFPIPAALSRVDAIRAEEHGDARSIAASSHFLTDTPDSLPAAVNEALGVEPLALPRGFESLGTDAEFGIVQRKLGLDVLNLFRFRDATLPALAAALADDLRALTDPEAVTVEPDPSEPNSWLVTVPKYDLRWPGFATGGDRAAILAELGWLRRKFLDGLRGGRKIYVLRRRQRIPVGEALAVLLELKRHGPATLLCVEPASGGWRPGEVALLLPGLMRGYVERFAPATDLESADPTDWLRVMANATLLLRELNTTCGA